MRRSIWTRVLVALLVISMVATPVSAAGWGNSSSWGWGSIWDRWFGGGNKVVVTEPTEPEEDEPVLTLVEDASTVDNGEGLRASTYVLTSEEDSVGANAVNAYSVMAAADEADTKATTTVKYFPVTMYNYNTNAINNSTHQAEVDAGLGSNWNGMYFSDGNPGATSYTYATSAGTHTDLTWAEVQAGTYYADQACTNKVTVTPIVEGSEGYTQVDVTGDELWASSNGTATNTWYETPYYYLSNGKYYVLSVQLSGGWYMVGYHNGSYYQTNGTGLGWRQATEIMRYYEKSGTITGYTLTAGDETLAKLDHTDTSAKVDVTLYTPAGTANTGSLSYAAWNFWGKINGNGDQIYTGLVQDTMVDDQIVFTVPEGGIFSNDTSTKAIYEYVGLPFVLKEYTEDNNDEGKLGLYYSFDSDENGAYFADTNNDGKADPQSGSINESGEITAYNLKFDEGNPQPLGFEVGDKSTNAFFPYNIHNGVSYNDSIDYHFGMRADLPFSMTPNGRIKSTDDKSAPIEFTFSGDDDVWVFIDGHLVIDLGGIHNRLDATIDFANNTITYSEENGADTDNSTSSYNDSDFSMSQQLFTADGDEGVIPMSRDAFALDPDHEMQVFYLERGEGTSNCRIEFNLPMNDTVLVTKNATRSWNTTNNNEEDLTDAEQAVINEMDFGFTLYKKEAGATAFTAVKNTNFYLVGRAVEGTVINSTDANGHFYLKNGQSAKFITEIPTEGVTYYVVEDKVPNGFVSPDFTYAGEASYNYSYTGITASDDDTENTKTVTGTAPAANANQIPKQVIPMPVVDADGNMTWAENKSFEVTVKGSIEANDSIEFICSNYMDATLPNPSVFAMEDIIVLDYGLSVKIDPLVNDLYRGDTVEILYVGGADVTLTTETASNGLVTGAWTEDDTLDFGSVELDKGTPTATDNSRDTFIYTLSKQLTEVEVLTYIVKTTGTAENAAGVMMENNAFSIGKVYIVPATVMYYEEDFSDLVTFTNNSKTGNAWGGTVETDGASANQEPGVVGTTTDSIYGTDVAYLDDSYDSNGTSRYCDTTNGALQFSYTFTGTGTTIFARTSDTTGYVQFKLYEGTDTSGTAKHITYRDTYWKDENTTDLDEKGTLYNIPIYTEEDLVYGTYTVVATVAKAGTKTAGNDNGSGKDFWLDGIRIMQPLNKDAKNAELTEKALGAYATDGESNIDTVTLRNKLITDDDTGDNAWNFAVLTDITGEVVLAEDYESIGPKEEVYLLPGQSVSFAVKYWHTDGYRMHMGMKAPFGNASVKVGQNTYNLENTVDCYFDITGSQSSVVTETDEDGNTYYVATYTFTATDKIVSLTNIKVVGSYKFVLIEDDDVVIDGSEN